jgi:hypothetical protein
MAESHATKIEDEGKFVRDGENAVEEATRLHKLATADPEPERDGILVSKEHEEKYGLERASDASIAVDTRGYIERTGPVETTAASRASSKK